MNKSDGTPHGHADVKKAVQGNFRTRCNNRFVFTVSTGILRAEIIQYPFCGFFFFRHFINNRGVLPLLLLPLRITTMNTTDITIVVCSITSIAVVRAFILYTHYRETKKMTVTGPSPLQHRQLKKTC